MKRPNDFSSLEIKGERFNPFGGLPADHCGPLDEELVSTLVSGIRTLSNF
jgi:hypothetical protein